MTAILMFAGMMGLLLTGQRVFGAIGSPPWSSRCCGARALGTLQRRDKLMKVPRC